jgi:hypothetical protein
MASAKEIRVAPISAKDAAALVKRIHYSGSTTATSSLHLGVFLNGRLEGAMQFGAPIDKRKVLPLVEGTPWNGFLELNRMAFSEALPKNSESRALSVAFRLIRKHYPHIQWVLSFADGAQCGDGTIYRASGFVLTGIRQNKTILKMPDGTIVTDLTLNVNAHRMGGNASQWKKRGAKPLEGFQLRYIYFLDPTARGRLTVPVIPFGKIDEMGATMYRGERMRSKQAAAGTTSAAAEHHRPERSNS